MCALHLVSAVKRVTVCNRYRAIEFFTVSQARVQPLQQPLLARHFDPPPPKTEVAERVLAVANGKNVDPVDDVAVNGWGRKVKRKKYLVYFDNATQSLRVGRVGLL